MRKISHFIFVLLLLLLIILAGPGCGPGKQSPTEYTPVSISDYGKALFSLDPFAVEEGLDSLSDTYHFFIGEDVDTLKALQIREFITDPLNRELATKAAEMYPDLTFLEDGLGRMFANIQTLIPGFETPRVYTYVSGLMYEAPVEYLDSVMIIALDMFLGWDFMPYRAAGLPVFMTRRMEPQNILPECARQVAISMLDEDHEPKNLLDHMLLHGKVLYTMDLFLPGAPDSLKIGYTAEQMQWCRKNEASVWRLFIDQEMLYRNDPFLNSRFIQDGPFTAGLPEGAPAMLGRYIGWEVIRAYMKKNPQVSLLQMFDISDSQQILSESGYKPRK